MLSLYTHGAVVAGAMRGTAPCGADTLLRLVLWGNERAAESVKVAGPARGRCVGWRIHKPPAEAPPPKPPPNVVGGLGLGGLVGSASWHSSSVEPPDCRGMRRKSDADVAAHASASVWSRKARLGKPLPKAQAHFEFGGPRPGASAGTAIAVIRQEAMRRERCVNSNRGEAA